MYDTSFLMFNSLICCCRSARRSAESNLNPNSIDGGLSPNGATMASPSDMVGPSPVTSNGTETTEIEDEIADEVELVRTPPARVPTADSQATVSAASLNKVTYH